eukprot:TRINITY_DN32489_c0_g1_i1.p1 TRINITY_DN32489_c0_g1~~TRINITY_DN32489_c0_g1_i1.p1  ORF type:complete len:327 (-),score=62.77 TRINITY_DN32489_c0_g1_i1:37-969(-)
MADFEVITGGSASSLKIRLRSGAAVKAESDALVSKTQSVELSASMDSGNGGGLGDLLGGVLGGAARSMLTGESFFLQTLRCPNATGECLVAPSEQGDIVVLELQPQQALQSVLVTSGAFLCAEQALNIETRVQGISKGLFSGGGFFLMRCSGRGKLALSCLGSCVKYDLAPGEVRQVDNGHLVAWSESVSYSVGMATNSVFGSLASGEGIMCTFTGPGPVWIQSHKPQPAESSGNNRGHRGSSASGDLVGKLMGCCFLCVFLAAFIGIFGLVAYKAITDPDSVEWGDSGGGGGGKGRRAIGSGRRMTDEF